jgi:hypothetical protein
MVKRRGHDYWALYVAKRKNKKRKSKGSVSAVENFLDDSLEHFRNKYGSPAKRMKVSKELNELIDKYSKLQKIVKDVDIEVVESLVGRLQINLHE